MCMSLLWLIAVYKIVYLTPYSFRLSDSSGMIADDVTGSQYLRNTQCMFLIEAER